MKTQKPLVPKLAIAAAGALAFAVMLWLSRPFWHGLLMVGYRYPLLTWMPVVIGALIAGAGYALSAARGNLRTRSNYYNSDALVVWPAWTAATVVAVQFTLCAIFLPAWQGHALYAASVYADVSELPGHTQPRILPKEAAQAYGDRENLKHAHLVVNPDTHELNWSAEKAPGGILHSGASKQIAIMPLDRLNGQMSHRNAGFDAAVSKMGAGSLPWRAYKRHYFTNVQERVIVPLAGGQVLAVAPYVGYKGFLVKRPYWKGVYVYHPDGRLEDLTPAQAMARPELAASGRLFPEKLARAQAQAYGYKHGISNTIAGHRDEIEVSDPDAYGNPQPYLTSLGSGRTVWVTVGNPQGDKTKIATVFLTDSATGKTQVWHAPEGRYLLSNEGAARLARTMRNADGSTPEWEREECCDSDGYSYMARVRWVTEPRPVFKDGRMYYLVSVMASHYYVKTREPVDKTVLIDASERTIVKVYDHTASSEADDSLRSFFGAAPSPLN